MSPNAHHFAAASAALDAGLDVVCDKPMTTTLDDALALVRRVRETGLVFCLTHNYSAYPDGRQARAMVAAGEIGPVRQVHLAYVQGTTRPWSRPTRPAAPGASTPPRPGPPWSWATSAPTRTTWGPTSPASS
jgi:predicted dehydrogenase